MSERPIIMSAESVRAILAGTKTQTRRVIITKPPATLVHGKVAVVSLPRIGNTLAYWSEPNGWLRCPYGVPGDRLYVKEAWRVRLDQDDIAPRDLPHRPPWYCATGNGHGDEQPSGCGGGVGKKRSPYHMPRWASRITLELTDVRVQRLQEVTNVDTRAEGVNPSCDDWACTCWRDNYRQAWDALNGKRAPWESNPWVWALTFRRDPGNSQVTQAGSAVSTIGIAAGVVN